jgi:hypothetical protein
MRKRNGAGQMVESQKLKVQILGKPRKSNLTQRRRVHRDHAEAAARMGGGGMADSLRESSTEVNFCQELLISDSNARSIGMTKAERLQGRKGLRERCGSNDLWKSEKV